MESALVVGGILVVNVIAMAVVLAIAAADLRWRNL